MDRQNNSEQESHDKSDELKDTQPTDNVTESVDITEKHPNCQATDDTQYGEDWRPSEEEESRNESKELKDTQTANNVAESVDTTDQATDEPQYGVDVRASELEELVLDDNEQHFRDDVQNHLTWIEETLSYMSSEIPPSLNFCKLLSKTRDDRLKDVQYTLNDGENLQKKGRAVEADFNQLYTEWGRFHSKVDIFILLARTSNEIGWLELNCNMLFEFVTRAGSKTAQCIGPKSSVNDYVRQISREDSPHHVTELIEEMFGTQSGVQTISHVGYICIYNLERRLGITYEYLTQDNFLGDAHRGYFKRGKDVTIFCPTCRDFRINGYHMGHLAASGNYKNSQDQRNDTFCLENAVPQNTKGNTWEKIEIYAQDLLEKHNHERLLVITGWLMIETRHDIGQAATVTHQKHNMLSVPTHLFKILITVNEMKPDGIAVFIVANNPNDGSCYDDLGAHLKLKKIENAHGYKFVPKIDTSELRDFSDHFENNVISDTAYKMKIAKKKIRDAKNEERLDKAYKSLGELKPSGSVENLYQLRKPDFQ